MYVRATKAKGKTYFSVVRSFRDSNGKPRTEHLVSLRHHRTVDDAIDAARTELAKAKQADPGGPRVEKWRETLAALKAVAEEMALNRESGEAHAERLRRFASRYMKGVADAIQAEGNRRLGNALEHAVALGFIVPGYLVGVPVEDWPTTSPPEPVAIKPPRAIQSTGVAKPTGDSAGLGGRMRARAKDNEAPPLTVPGPERLGGPSDGPEPGEAD